MKHSTKSVLRLALVAVILRWSSAEYLQEFEISEGLGVGTTIGYIGQAGQSNTKPPPPPYLIVPVPGSAVDSDLHIDQSSGEIQSSIVLDREVRSYYSFVAIPLSGENIRVEIKVRDENDNAPTFPTPFMAIEFPENTPRDMKRTLNPAKDRDLGIFNTQRYEIVSGNTNNAFRLSSHREKDDVLYLDLQINGFLDRETTPFYSLLIEAYDGGTPPLKGSMTVNITIQDVNDNQPIFNQSRYFATIAENATVGTSVLRVFATDTDTGENGRITYSINRRQSDRDNKFTIDPKAGVISVNKPLDFESKDVHELVVVARDNGAQPLETTSFVSIRVTDVNDNQPTINLIFLSEDASPKISEDAKPGEFVARISVNDPDSKEEYANVNVTLQGGDGHFGLTTQDNIIYLVIVSHPLDREAKPNYTMIVTATDQGNPPLNTSRTFELRVTDTNDNAPEFDHTMYYANVLEVADPGTSVFQLSALDRDEGNNSVVTYSIKDTPETNSQWFQIDSRTGLITTRTHIDCETNPIPQITVVAVDNGIPPLSSSATVVVTISDVNDNEPIFDQSFYNVTVAENEKSGACILKISATDPDCGVNAMVNYTYGAKGSSSSQDFVIQPVSGDLCIAKPLDYETRTSYEIPVLATDRGGLSTTAMIKVQVLDVNDNRPVFYPVEYNVSLPEGIVVSTPVVAVVATDFDSGVFGKITYEIIAGNELNYFQIDRHSGEVFVRRSLSSTHALHHLVILAKDGGGLMSSAKAHVYISVISSDQQPPVFKQARYTFFVQEDAAPQSVVGTVVASVRDPRAGHVRYAIYSGDPQGFFIIDALSGTIKTKGHLDHESHPSVLLNVQATTGKPPIYGHTQVNITIWDVNDNAPKFSSDSLKISVPENADTCVPIYVIHAEDPDSNRNGEVHYYLLENPHNLFSVDEKSGSVMLQKTLDYESRRHYILVLSASDAGSPPMSSNVTLMVEVQDVNDNPPVFEKSEYKVSVLESLPVNSQFVQVTATDMDTGNNARLTYKLHISGEDSSVFGIFPNSGFLYLKEALDRESEDSYELTIIAWDNGSPPLSASSSVLVQVLDANDNEPEFLKETFIFSVYENTEQGFYVGTLSARDSDLGNNASLRYSFSNSNGSFQINPVTGEIFTMVPLDREHTPKYSLIAEVRDQGDPPQSSQAAVEIQVLDRNDNPPVFIEPLETTVEVMEEQPLGTEVVQVVAEDADENENAAITYAIFSGKAANIGTDAFLINRSTGMITTKKLLDHEEQKLYTLTVVATDSGSPPLQSLLKLQIKVMDLNDNQPVFPTSSLSFRIKEGISVGQEIGVVQAVDEDGGENGRVMYSIVGGNLYGIFDIVRSTGSLYTIAPVDYEKASEYHLQIKAVDNSATNSHSSVISVKIEVEDINDCAPVFKNDPILFSIPESTADGSIVWNFSATDLDSGVNGQVTYFISQQSPASVFKIDEKTGALILTETLDYEAYNEYTIVVTASDKAKDFKQRLATSVTCKIIVEDENDNSPVFKSRSRVDVMESEPVGYPVMHIIATDLDSRDNGRVTYVITQGNGKGHFNLDYDTGLLSVAKPLDREVTNHYELNITASDHGQPPHSSSLILHVYVEDVNDNPPRFKQHLYQANVSEAAPRGTFVLKVEATDIDIGANGKLEFMIPVGVADNKFTINSQTGEIHTSAFLDREEKSSYLITVYVHDGASPSRFDATTVKVDLLDVNDHAPEFGDSCYTLHLPENSDLSVVHTLVATDKDINSNSELTYTITDGNIGNMFSIDLHTGQLSSRPLDRERVSQYRLVVTAHDQGEPPLAGTCNISIIVLDQNDNDPVFEHSEYSATVPEDVSLNTVVLTVRAVDQDEGLNSMVTYSLTNETKSFFRINSTSGVITTAGNFDREKKAFYAFEVRATDGGSYDVRSEKALVHVTVVDVNDNRPKFKQYPFVASVSAHAAPGTLLIQIEAEDKDEGPNGEVVYSFSSSYLAGRFHLDSDTGVITVAGSLLADSGQVFHCELKARDKGHPPRTATGILEIHVGEDTGYASTLYFQNDTYVVDLPENSPSGKEVVQVKAVPLNPHSSSITYVIKSGNEENTFEINPRTGMITVHDEKQLDYELVSQLQMLVAAQEGATHVYASLMVHLIDENDNHPSFSQSHYVASVWEGNSKGTFVTQVTATDEDQNGNGALLYHIIEGNHDNAFVIDPPFSGIIKTNIVLDREIRESYHLTIIATDDGSPQLSGTCTLRIVIIDVNDNQPVFPPHSVVSISEGAEVGTILTTITANDVDTNPALIYSFAENGNPSNLFSIDRFSGRITLAKPLDHEKQQSYLLLIHASDSAHLAYTSVTVHVTDINDNPPVFSQQPYQVTVPELVEPGYRVITVNASDQDSGVNAHLQYSLGISAVEGFCINENDGTIYTNKTLTFDPRHPTIQLIVTAEDRGDPSLTAVAAVHVQVVDINNNAPKFSSPTYTTHVSEDALKGSTILKVSATDHDKSFSNHNIDYRITDGNDDNSFAVAGTTGEIILMKSLDREQKSRYLLKVVATDRGSPALNSTTEVLVFVDDINDNQPVFNQTHYEASVSEMAAIDTTVLQVFASDVDEGPHSKVLYDITSGNDDKKFSLDPNTGIIRVQEKLDYDTVQEYRFIVRATDSDPDRPLSALASVLIKVQDENDNAPHFPLLMYKEAIEENSPVGSPVFMAHAIDADRGIYGKLNYSLTEGEGKGKFHVEPETGLVRSLVVFDYESKKKYFFTLMAMDAGGKYATVQVQVDIESKDEYPPEFTHSSYHFVVPGDAPTGYAVGSVHATDMDDGIDGHVIYHLKNSQGNFEINSSSGVIIVKSGLQREGSEHPRQEVRNKEVSLFVIANSGRPGSLSSSTVVNVFIDFSLNVTRLHSTEQKIGSTLPDWGLGLVIALSLLASILLAMIFFLRKRTKRNTKPAVVQGFDSSFDTIDIHPPPSSSASISQFPPHYSDISHFDPPESAQHVNGTTSEVSDQSHSASSGRGSAEEGDDVEDEEIRMINEGPLLQQQKLQRLGMTDNGIHRDDDNMSDISVHNTQEYLARLGINTSISDQRSVQDYSKVSNTHSVENIHIFDEDGVEDGDSIDISNLIYSKLHEVGAEESDTTVVDGTRGFGFADEVEPSMTGSLSSIVHSEEELTGSYNWDYLLDWGPQYQPLAHVFAEIARLKDDSVPSSYSSSGQQTLNPQVKTVPPPLITNVAPRSIAPVALNSGHTSQVSSFPTLPRSPIGHDSTFSSPAMSPSFSPALSPLATRSPSISPLMLPAGSSSSIQMLCTNVSHHQRHSSSGNNRTVNVTSSGSEAELHI